MIPEARLDRLERMAMLLVRAGYRARREFRQQIREHDRLLNHLANLQIENEEKFAKHKERFASNEERFSIHEELITRHEQLFARNEERFAVLTESQISTDRRLKELIEIVARRYNGDTAGDSAL